MDEKQSEKSSTHSSGKSPVSLAAKSHHQYSSASTLGQEEIAELFAKSKEKWKLFEEESFPQVFEATPPPPPHYFEEIFRVGSNSSTRTSLGRVVIPSIVGYPVVIGRSLSLFEEPWNDEPQMVSNFPQSMETEQRHQNFAHRGVSGICGVPARLSGMVSLALQTIVLVLSCLVIGIFFVHAGGYKYFNKSGASVASESFLVMNPDEMNNETTAQWLISLPTPQSLISPSEMNESDLLPSNSTGIDEMDAKNSTSVGAVREVEAAMSQENQVILGDEFD